MPIFFLGPEGIMGLEGIKAVDFYDFPLIDMGAGLGLESEVGNGGGGKPDEE